MTGARPRGRIPAHRPGAPRAAPSAVAVAAAAGAVACAVLAAGCGSTPAPGAAAGAASAAGPPPLASSVTTTGGTSWAVLEMGGSRAEHNNFWQLLARPAGGSRWALATPPGVADNGGLVAAPLGSRGLVAGFNPSQDLTFSPLATTRDGGAHWAPGLLPAGLAAVPSALAAGPGGRMLALTGQGRVQASGPSGAGGGGGGGGPAWTALTSLAALARTPAGRACGLTGLTSAAFSPAGAPMLAGTCSRPGVTGIFSFTGGGWHAAGPVRPAALAHRRVTVLRLAPAGSRTLALLSTVPASAPGGAAAGTGTSGTGTSGTGTAGTGTAGTGTADTGTAGGSAQVLAAWAPADGPWVLSAPLTLGGKAVISTAAGPGGTAGVVVGTGLGATVTPVNHTGEATAAAPWHQLPALPAHSADLVLGPATQVSSLAPDGSLLVSWRLSGTGTWVRQQVMKVPVPLGSSG